MIKLDKARSLLHRRHNIRWKALDEIYKIYMLLHRSDLNFSANCVKLCCLFRLFGCYFHGVAFHGFLRIARILTEL